MSNQYQAVLLGGIPQRHTTDFEINAGVVRKRHTALGILVSMLIWGIELFEQARESLTKGGQLLFLHP
jgi:hypothetical protein